MRTCPRLWATFSPFLVDEEGPALILCHGMGWKSWGGLPGGGGVSAPLSDKFPGRSSLWASLGQRAGLAEGPLSAGKLPGAHRLRLLMQGSVSHLRPGLPRRRVSTSDRPFSRMRGQEWVIGPAAPAGQERSLPRPRVRLHHPHDKGKPCLLSPRDSGPAPPRGATGTPRRGRGSPGGKVSAELATGIGPAAVGTSPPSVESRLPDT